jgi:hypothetical protein
MLIRFHSPAFHDITMFGADGRRLIELMGMSGRIPSAVNAEDLPAVKARLLAGIESAPPPPAPEDADETEESDAARFRVPLKTRALPLLSMLDAAIAKDAYVMWEETR